MEVFLAIDCFEELVLVTTVAQALKGDFGISDKNVVIPGEITKLALSSLNFLTRLKT